MQQGIISTVNSDNKSGTLIYEGRLYSFTLLGESKDTITPGFIAEIEILKAPSFFARGKCKVLDCHELEMGNYTVDNFVLTTKSTMPDTVHFVSRDDEYFFIAEASDLNKAFAMLIDEAKKANANCLYNISISTSSYMLRAKSRFIVKGNVAQIKADNIKPQDGMNLYFDKKIVRRNSPNNAMTRYIRVLILCLYIILVPCILRLANLGNYSLDVAIFIASLYTLLSLFTALITAYQKDCTYRMRS